MIRPFSFICVLLAAGSGLYLYHVKDRTRALDQRIAGVLQDAAKVRAEAAMLQTTYAELTQQDRIARLAGRYLALRPAAPTQFVQLAALDAALPPVQVFPKPGEAPPAAANLAHADDPRSATDQDEDVGAQTEATLTPVAVAPIDRADIHPATSRLAAIASLVIRPDGADATPRPRASAATKLAQGSAPPRIPHPASHSEPQVFAAASPVASSVLAAARFEPTPRAYHPPLRTAEAAMPAQSYTHARAQPAETASGGSVLGQSSAVALAPPVPVAN